MKKIRLYLYKVAPEFRANLIERAIKYQLAHKERVRLYLVANKQRQAIVNIADLQLKQSDFDSILPFIGGAYKCL